MDNKMYLSFSTEIKLTEEELNSLRGGMANVIQKEEQKSESGDGAEYVCCIKIDKK